MLKANDLRIGNKVYYNTGESIEIHSIDSIDIKLAEQYNLLFNANHKPISLTEEWLLKMGFKKSNYIIITNTIFYEKGEHQIFYYLDENIFKYDMLLLSDGVVIQYVHQLQNLYYALTNEELIIKL